MQIKLQLRAEKPLILPFNYNYPLQSALYKMLGEVGESDFWHDNGFGDVTKYKGFCFSALTGRYTVDREAKKLCFAGDIHWELRSPVFGFIDALQRSLELHPQLRLYDTRLDIVAAALENTHLPGGQVQLDAVTPVVVHSTTDDGHSRFYTPDEAEFYTRICDNIARKYESITGTPTPELLLRPTGDFKKTVTRYKGLIINGYTGGFEIKTTLKTAEFIYNTGLGEKNAQGFGFVELPGKRC